MARLTRREIDDYAAEYFPIVKKKAEHWRPSLPSGVKQDAFINAASEALVKSLHTFDPSHGVPLSAWISQNVEDALLAAEYSPIVKKKAEHWRPNLPSAVKDDLVGVGLAALAKSFDTFDPSLGVPRSAWIAQAVERAFQDHLRSLDPLSQEKRKLVKEVTQAEQDLEKSLHRKPTSVEIARRLNWDEEQVREIQQAGLTTVLSMEEGMAEAVEQKSDREGFDPVHQTALRQKERHFQECFTALTDQEQTALRMRFEGRPLREIAQALQLSTATADRRVQAALSKVANCMRKEGWL